MFYNIQKCTVKSIYNRISRHLNILPLQNPVYYRYSAFHYKNRVDHISIYHLTHSVYIYIYIYTLPGVKKLTFSLFLLSFSVSFFMTIPSTALIYSVNISFEVNLPFWARKFLPTQIPSSKYN